MLQRYINSEPEIASRLTLKTSRNPNSTIEETISEVDRLFRTSGNEEMAFAASALLRDLEEMQRDTKETK
jgi:hypothetical protein